MVNYVGKRITTAVADADDVKMKDRIYVEDARCDDVKIKDSIYADETGATMKK